MGKEPELGNIDGIAPADGSEVGGGFGAVLENGFGLDVFDGADDGNNDGIDDGSIFDGVDDGNNDGIDSGFVVLDGIMDDGTSADFIDSDDDADFVADSMVGADAGAMVLLDFKRLGYLYGITLD